MSLADFAAPVRAIAALGVLALALGSGCNMLSRADEISIRYEHGHVADGEGGEPGSGGGAAPSGSGGGAVADAGADAGAGGAPAPACMYPLGPYGVTKDKVLSPSLKWQGFPPESEEQATIMVGDYLDCEGTRGINAVLFTTHQFGCEACKKEASELEALALEWQPLGIEVVVLVLNTPDNKPGTVQSALKYKKGAGLVSMAVVSDPKFSLVVGNTVGTPLMTVVDPRTMRVVYRQEGYSGQYFQLVSLAKKNKAQ
ncbi:MAG: redoxin domain-containing protein [Deltaproteobacteria bacterium]|nr:redoxin domain-containing protein [Deltaproteobacteria bacterium]